MNIEYKVKQNEFDYWVCEVWTGEELWHTTTTSNDALGAFTYGVQFVARQTSMNMAMYGEWGN